MKKVIGALMAAFGLLAAFTAEAQSMGESIKMYSSGPITWDDFTVKEMPDSAGIEFSFASLSSLVQGKAGNLRYNRIDINTAFIKSSAFVGKDHMDDKNLKYVQTLFDLYNVYSKRCEAEIDTSKTFSPDAIIDYYYYKQANSAARELKKESRKGEDTALVAEYSSAFAEELKKFEESGRVPSTAHKPFGYGMSFELGGDFMTGRQKEYLSPEFLIGFSFEFAYKRSMFDIYLGVGAGRTMQALQGSNFVWPAKKTYSDVRMSLGYSYYAFENDYWKLGPMVRAGFGGISASQKLDSGKATGDGFNVFRAAAGIDCRYKMRRTLSSQSYSEYTLFTKLSAEYSSYSPTLCNGFSVNFTIGIDFLGFKRF